MDITQKIIDVMDKMTNKLVDIDKQLHELVSLRNKDAEARNDIEKRLKDLEIEYYLLGDGEEDSQKNLEKK